MNYREAEEKEYRAREGILTMEEIVTGSMFVEYIEHWIEECLDGLEKELYKSYVKHIVNNEDMCYDKWSNYDRDYLEEIIQDVNDRIRKMILEEERWLYKDEDV